jgi:hypothetical protein
MYTYGYGGKLISKLLIYFIFAFFLKLLSVAQTVQRRMMEWLMDTD